MKVVLIGMKHCGKSTLGQALAQRWACPFQDLDRLLEQRQAAASGQPLSVREIYAQLGQERFDELEAQALCQLADQLRAHPGPHVTALGGRTVLNQRVGERLRDLGRLVYLEVPAEEMLRRVLRGGLPPWLNPQDPRADFLRIYQERVPRYRQLAEITVDLDGLSVPASLQKLLGVLERCPN